jgi:serine/threonine protein kinase
MKPETLIQQALEGKYEIQSIIGKGGMATVYKTIQTNLYRPMANNLIHQNLVHNDEFVMRFMRNIMTYKKLSHSYFTISILGCFSSLCQGIFKKLHKFITVLPGHFVLIIKLYATSLLSILLFTHTCVL